MPNVMLWVLPFLFVMRSVIVLDVIMLSVIILNVVKLIVFMESVVGSLKWAQTSAFSVFFNKG